MNHETAFDGQSVLRIGTIEVRFYVREPSPGRWNAIGVLNQLDKPFPRCASGDTHCRMIVGVGGSRDEAIGDLIARVLKGQHPVLVRQSATRDLVGQTGSVC